MKTLICLIMLICCTAAGFLKSGSLKKRAHELEGLRELIKNTESEISSYKRPVCDAVSRASSVLSGYELPEMIASHLKTNGDINAVWHALDPDMLTDSDISVADEFFALLGMSGRDDQVSLCRDTLSRLDSNYENAKENCEKKCTLYKSLGFLSGLLLIILVV